MHPFWDHIKLEFQQYFLEVTVFHEINLVKFGDSLKHSNFPLNSSTEFACYRKLEKQLMCWKCKQSRRFHEWSGIDQEHVVDIPEVPRVRGDQESNAKGFLSKKHKRWHILEISPLAFCSFFRKDECDKKSGKFKKKGFINEKTRPKKAIASSFGL